LIKRKDKNLPMIVTFLAPAMILYALIFLYPVVRTVVTSFFEVKAIAQPVSTWTFNGIANYLFLFGKGIFNVAFGNMLKLWFVGGIVVLLLAMVFAVILTSGARLKRFWRSVIYLPNVISAVAMGTMWLNYVYSKDYGLFNNVIKLFGGEPVPWTGPGTQFWSMVIAYGFGMVGYHMLIFISGIEKIGVDYYEAASIEGANIFQKFFQFAVVV